MYSRVRDNSFEVNEDGLICNEWEKDFHKEKQ